MNLVWVVTCGMVLSGAGLWFLGKKSEQRESKVKIQSLEAKLQLSQSRTNQINQDLVRLQQDLNLAQQNLEREQHEKSTLIREYAQPIRRFNLVLIILGVTFGLIFGSLAAASYSDKVHTRQVTQIEVKRAVAETRLRDLQAEREKNELIMEELRRDLQLEMEARIIAQTKLEIFAQSEQFHFKEGRSLFGLGKSRRASHSDSKENSHFISIPMANASK